jgi:hypothetical protein
MLQNFNIKARPRPAEASAPLKLNLSRACRTEVTYSTAAGENIKVVQVFWGRRVTRGRQPPREKMRRSQRWGVGGPRGSTLHTHRSAPLSSHCTRACDENTNGESYRRRCLLEAGGGSVAQCGRPRQLARPLPCGCALSALSPLCGAPAGAAHSRGMGHRPAPLLPAGRLRTSCA